jgi:hypothetical protein
MNFKFHLKGLSPTIIKVEQSRDSTPGESAISVTTIKYWVEEFKRGCTILLTHYFSLSLQASTEVWRHPLSEGHIIIKTNDNPLLLVYYKPNTLGKQL